MPGMECWNSAYEGAAGKDAMIAELERLLWEYPEVKTHFNDLNAENLEKAAAELTAAFAENARQAKSLTNKVADLETERGSIVNSMTGLSETSDEWIAFNDELTEVDADILENTTARDNYNE
jgi:peptidoglycan hydrolase CwlO-like protein